MYPNPCFRISLGEPTLPRQRSESVLQSELDLAHRYSYFGDSASCIRTIVDEVVRLRKIRVIKEVEEFYAEFKLLPFRYSKFFSQRSVKDVLTGTDQVVAPRIAKRESSRRRKGVDIEPKARTSLIGREVPIPELIRA